MKIRKASLKDIDKLKDIGKRTFAETFSSENSEENMLDYLKNAFSTEAVKKELSDENAEIYFAEIEEEEIIGYLKVNFG